MASEALRDGLSMWLISRWRSSSLCASRLTSAAVSPSPGSARGFTQRGDRGVCGLGSPGRPRLAFDEMVRFIADQRIMHLLPHAVTCAIPGAASAAFTSGCTGNRHRPRSAAASSAQRSRPHLRRRSAPTGHRASMPISLRRLDGEREHGRRRDATTRPAGSETEAPEGHNQAGQRPRRSSRIGGNASSPRRRRSEVVWRHDRDPDR